VCRVLSDKQILLVPVDTLKINFEYNTITEELFNFKNDSLVSLLLGSPYSPVYSPPGSFNSLVCSPLGSLNSPVYSSLESQKFDSLVYSTQGRINSQCIHHQGVTNSNPRCIMIPPCIHHRGIKTPPCTHHRGVVFTVLSCFKSLPWLFKAMGIHLKNERWVFSFTHWQEAHG
jgi:hypothetical protein